MGKFLIRHEEHRFDARIELPVHLVEPGPAAEHGILAGNHGRVGLETRRHERGGEIARADILGQRAAYLIRQVGRNLYRLVAFKMANRGSGLSDQPLAFRTVTGASGPSCT